MMATRSQYTFRGALGGVVLAALLAADAVARGPAWADVLHVAWPLSLPVGLILVPLGDGPQPIFAAGTVAALVLNGILAGCLVWWIRDRMRARA
jgi:hypothetical protein